METNNTVNPLATAPIPQLLLRYSVPTALTLLVNYLYNIVDQIFVGQGVGITGMAATNVAFPLTIVSMAVALMIGDGCAANINLYLGRKGQDAADRIISHTVTLLLGAGMLVALLGSLFARRIVLLFGATSTSFRAALDYTRVIVLGLPFLMFCSALTAIIRADGNPKFAMKAMMLGAAINLVLDPLFIFGFHMGVVGAGIATVIGEVASGLLYLSRLRHMQTVHIRKEWLLPTPSVSLQILRLGFPSFLTQIMTAVVQVTMNNLMKHCGAATTFGSDVALSVYGALMKIYQIAHAMFVGVSSATQPINGYNFGAKQFRRVRDTYKTASSIALLVSAGWFAVYQLFPRAHWVPVCLRGPGVPERLRRDLPPVHDGIFRVWTAHDHHLLLPEHRPASQGPVSAPCPAGGGPHPVGAPPVPSVRPEWRTAGRSHGGCNLFSALLAAGKAGVFQMEKAGMVGFPSARRKLRRSPSLSDPVSRQKSNSAAYKSPDALSRIRAFELETRQSIRAAPSLTGGSARPKPHIWSKMGIKDFPRSVRLYSTLGGIWGYSSRWTSWSASSSLSVELSVL